MGKKRAVKKIMEVSVGIGESSSTEPQTTPRKRGRPRKITEKQEERAVEFQDLGGTDSKKTKTNKEEIGDKLEDIKEEYEGSSSKSNKEEGKSEAKELSSKQQQQPPKRSRAKKKSKPRKSSNA